MGSQAPLRAPAIVLLVAALLVAPAGHAWEQEGLTAAQRQRARAILETWGERAAGRPAGREPEG